MLRLGLKEKLVEVVSKTEVPLAEPLVGGLGFLLLLLPHFFGLVCPIWDVGIPTQVWLQHTARLGVQVLHPDEFT